VNDGMPVNTAQMRTTNRVLASIPAKEYKRLQAHLEPIDLNFGEVIYEPGMAIGYVYFPIDCLISLLTAVDKRRTLEVGMVGNEGMAGMPFILGMGVSGCAPLCRVPATRCAWPRRLFVSSSNEIRHCRKRCTDIPMR
jgi:hypothetical protein